jgi:predicted amidohydrolase YtcJ
MSEMLLTGGVVLTMDPDNARAQALLIRGNRIHAVGAASEVRQAADRSAEVIDLGGRTVLPGFNDGHAHVQDLGSAENQPNLESLNRAEIIERLQEEESRLPPGQLLHAAHWDYPTCPDPHLSHLDKVFPDRSVFLMQFSGHAAWVNSAALRELKIDRNTPDWEGGGPDHDQNGELTGILREPGGYPGVRKLWLKMIRNKTAVRENLKRALTKLAECGITSAQDNTWLPWYLDAITRAHRNGNLTARLSCWSFGAMPPVDAWFGLKRFNRDWYHKGPRKMQLDGAFSSHTAWLSEPYADQPETVGAGTPADKITPWLTRATRRGRQIACHSIGDASTHAYIAAAEAIGDPIRIAELRHRVEHGQLVSDEDIERAARMGMVFCSQPYAAANPEKDAWLLGEQRAARAYPYRSLIDAGVHLAFGSDFPGESTFNPFEAIHVAVNRAGTQAVSVEEALYCYTAGSAYAEFRENEKGMLRPGLLADVVVISDDPTSINPSKIKEIRVDATIVDGTTVYARDGEIDFGADAQPRYRSG